MTSTVNMTTTILLNIDIIRWGESALIATILGLLVFIGLISLFFALGWYITNRPGAVSPYSKREMAPGSVIAFRSVEKIEDFFEDIQSQENRSFNLERAAVCRETGRIFPNCLSNFDVVTLNRNYLSAVHPGQYIDWEVLGPREQAIILAKHNDVSGYQIGDQRTKFQGQPIPSLYVDISTNTLIGWKKVPGTELQILVVQKPRNVAWA
jgi:hypothetical protein